MDRTKDLVKSGGEWIPSVDLENAIMAHPKVMEAAVIAVFHPKWQERPLACIAPLEQHRATHHQAGDSGFPDDENHQVVAPRRHRVPRSSPQNQRRQIQQTRPARTVQRLHLAELGNTVTGKTLEISAARNQRPTRDRANAETSCLSPHFQPQKAATAVSEPTQSPPSRSPPTTPSPAPAPPGSQTRAQAPQPPDPTQTRAIARSIAPRPLSVPHH